MSTRASSQSPEITASDSPAPPTSATPHQSPAKGDNKQQEDAPSSQQHTGGPVLPFDLVFARLQSEFTHLSDEQARINTASELLAQRESAVREAEEKLVSLKLQADKQLERAEQERKVTAVQYEAAVEMENVNEKKEKELKRLENELGWREEEVERMEREISSQQAARERDAGKLVFIGPTPLEIGDRSPITTCGSAQPPVVPKKNREISIVGPRSGRTLSMDAFAQHTPPPGVAPTYRPGGIFIPDNVSPFQRGSIVVPRRISSDDLSSAGPTPVQTRPSASEIELLSPVSPVGSGPPAGVWEKAEKKVGLRGRDGEGEKRPRGKSVRRISRHEDLSSLRKASI